MEYTEEIKKEADSVYNHYLAIVTNNSNLVIVHDITIKAAIQDRQSVLDALDSLYPKGGCNCDVTLDRLIQSLTQQIEYLQSKL